MTMRTSSRIVCECGHEGVLNCAETDQPYGGLWEQYELEGFSGGNPTIRSYADMPKDLLAALSPRCPKCGKTGNVRYAK